MSNGKGSKRRPMGKCSTEEFNDRWAMAFGKKEEPKEMTLFGMPVIVDDPNDKTEHE